MSFSNENGTWGSPSYRFPDPTPDSRYSNVEVLGVNTSSTVSWYTVWDRYYLELYQQSLVTDSAGLIVRIYDGSTTWGRGNQSYDFVVNPYNANLDVSNTFYWSLLEDPSGATMYSAYFNITRDSTAADIPSVLPGTNTSSSTAASTSSSTTPILDSSRKIGLGVGLGLGIPLLLLLIGAVLALVFLLKRRKRIGMERPETAMLVSPSYHQARQAPDQLYMETARR